MAKRKAGLPDRDSQGRKLPMTFRLPKGALAVKSNKPTGDEVRVVIQDPGAKPQLSTFRNMDHARQFINNVNVGSRIGRQVKLEFGNGKKQRLRPGQKV